MALVSKQILTSKKRRKKNETVRCSAECAVPAGGEEGCISMHNPPGFVQDSTQEGSAGLRRYSTRPSPFGVRRIHIASRKSTSGRISVLRFAERLN